MKVISLFSGAGGMDLGFLKAGFEVVWANDIWEDAVTTYRLNLGDHIFSADIAGIPSREIPDADVLIGGFPCQGFSVANRNRHSGDLRNSLYLEYRRVLREKQPKFFIAENVKGLLSLDGGAVFRTILGDFREAGYRVTAEVLNAADYGVPQKRERVFLFGVRSDVSLNSIFPPRPTHAPHRVAEMAGLLPWISIGQALSGLPEPGKLCGLPNHSCSMYKLRFNGHQGHRVIKPEEPSPTITARGDDRGGVVIHHHPGNHRRMSPREVALVQSFPIDYQFFGPNTSVYRQVANAVPPRLAFEIARWLRCAIEVSQQCDSLELELAS